MISSGNQKNDPSDDVIVLMSMEHTTLTCKCGVTFTTGVITLGDGSKHHAKECPTCDAATMERLRAAAFAEWEAFKKVN